MYKVEKSVVDRFLYRIYKTKTAVLNKCKIITGFLVDLIVETMS